MLMTEIIGFFRPDVAYINNLYNNLNQVCTKIYNITNQGGMIYIECAATLDANERAMIETTVSNYTEVPAKNYSLFASQIITVKSTFYFVAFSFTFSGKNCDSTFFGISFKAHMTNGQYYKVRIYDKTNRDILNEQTYTNQVPETFEVILQDKMPYIPADIEIQAMHDNTAKEISIGAIQFISQ